MSPAVSVLWALLPLLTCGLGTMFVVGWAAYRLRSRWLAFVAAFSLVATIAALSLSGSSQASGQGSVAGALILVVLIGGGLTVTFAVRGRLVRRDNVWRPDRPGPATVGARSSGGVDPAVAEALARRGRRSEARRIVEQDPALARELGIGRPDLPRRFDDGGLVDVNHAPLPVLAGLPGLTTELAGHIARVRDQHGGFAFLEEMAAYTDLPDGLVDELAERLIFLR
jgi:hypothetical protein